MNEDEPLGEWAYDDKVAGPVYGILIAFNCLAEALIASKAIHPERLAALLEAKSEQLRSGDPDAVRVDAAVILDMALKPLRSAERSAARRLLNEPPHGSS